MRIEAGTMACDKVRDSEALDGSQYMSAAIVKIGFSLHGPEDA